MIQNFGAVMFQNPSVKLLDLGFYVREWCNLLREVFHSAQKEEAKLKKRRQKKPSEDRRHFFYVH